MTTTTTSSTPVPPVLDWDTVWNQKDIMDYILSYKEIPEPVETLSKRWEQECWDKGLAERVRNSKYKGMSGTFGDVLLMTYAICGRVLMTLERGDVSVTFICAEQERAGTGMQYIDASFNQVQELIQTVFDNWDPVKMQDDKEVAIAGT